MKIVWNKHACYACRTCELVCSFHHENVFSPEISSIKVTLNNQTGVITWNRDSTCDACNGQSQPQCVAYCPYGALKEVQDK